MGADAPLPLGARIYRVLLILLLPAEFRRQFADEMTVVHAELEREATGRGVAFPALHTLAAELPGLLRLAVREHRAARAARAARSTMSRSRTDMLDSTLQDLRYAARALRRSPVFALVAVLTLALGIGANTAIFSLVDGVLLSPLPFHEPTRLVAVGEASASGRPTEYSTMSPGNFFDLQRQASTVQLGGVSTREATLLGHGEPERLVGARTIGGVFDVLGVPALLGRTLRADEESESAEPVVVLSHAIWRRLFDANPDVLGRTLMLDGSARTIVGVMPPSFGFPDGGTEFWVPYPFEDAFRANRDQYFIQVVGRLVPGADLESARAELSTVAARLQQDWPTHNAELRIVALPLRDTVVEGVRTRLLVLMGAVGFVLLITCANLGNLLLARAAARRTEMAVRQALGAGRARVTRQLLTESLLLALAGGAAGVVIGRVFLSALLAVPALDLPRAHEVGLDGRVLLFTLAISVAAALFLGSLPAWQLTRAQAGEALRTGRRGSVGHQWARRVLVISEIALAMVLLTGAGLLLRSFALLQRVDPGFSADQILTFDLAVRDAGAGFVPASVERLAAIPGVQSVAVVNQLPVTGSGISAWFNRLDRPLPPNVKPTAEAYRVVTPEYFATIRLPLRRGRLLTDEDDRRRPGVVINEALARKYYPGEEPIGREIYLGAPDFRLFESGVIVGIVGDTRDAGLGSAPLPAVYVPFAAMPSWPQFSYVVRTEGSPTAVAGAVRGAIAELDASLPVRNMRTLDAVLADSVAPARWSMTLLGAFAVLALVLASLGVFGLLSFLVSQRTRELGIRIALGAAPSAVRRMVVQQGLALVFAGLALGVVGALALTRLMASLLYGVSPTDPATFAGVSFLLLSVAALASFLPARRATRVDPVTALRAE